MEQSIEKKRSLRPLFINFILIIYMPNSEVIIENANVKYMLENRLAIKKIAEILKKLLNNETLTTEEKSAYIQQLGDIMNETFSL